MRCHAVFLNGWPAAKTGMEGEKKEGDVHGEIGKRRSVSCGTMGLEEEGEREGSAAVKSSSPGGAGRSDKEITSVMVAAKPGQ